jgi:hypothetical protein
MEDKNTAETVTTTVSATPAAQVINAPVINGPLPEGTTIIITTDGTYKRCPHCGSLILNASVKEIP